MTQQGCERGRSKSLFFQHSLLFDILFPNILRRDGIDPLFVGF
jgi:hypothetical protein